MKTVEVLELIELLLFYKYLNDYTPRIDCKFPSHFEWVGTLHIVEDYLITVRCWFIIS